MATPVPRPELNSYPGSSMLFGQKVLMAKERDQFLARSQTEQGGRFLVGHPLGIYQHRPEGPPPADHTTALIPIEIF